MNKASGGDGIPVELFQILNDELWNCWTQYASKFGKLSSGHRTGKGQFSFQSQRKAMPQKCSNNCIIALISHTSKVMLKILQARLQHYVNHELPDIQARFRKVRATRVQIAKIRWIIKKARVPEKHLFLTYWLCQSYGCVDHNKLWKILKEMGIPDHLTCLLRNLYGGQAATVRTAHGTTDWFQIGKGVHQGLLLCTESYLLLDTVSTLFPWIL